MDGGLSHSDWLGCFEQKLHQWLKEQQQTNGSSAADVERLTQTNVRLDKEVVHYKKVLSQTEEILQSLQRSVEQEEKKWRSREENHQKERLLWQEERAQAQKRPTERERQLEGRCAALELDLRQLQGLQETTSEVCGMQFAFSCIERTLPGIVNEVVGASAAAAPLWATNHHLLTHPCIGAAFSLATLTAQLWFLQPAVHFLPRFSAGGFQGHKISSDTAVALQVLSTRQDNPRSSRVTEWISVRALQLAFATHRNYRSMVSRKGAFFCAASVLDPLSSPVTKTDG
ncbi:hypothetical protein V5799_025448 [Amblyomma americanum]|uniref:Uncharacterized protein n=1 Tax=Amblyomma americanum TaxID=6943 RepID=A0AAQ4E990_AMBAM